MKKWSKLLAVPMVLALFAGCGDQAADGEENTQTEETEETTQTEGTTEESSENTEDSDDSEDATSEATADEEGSEDGDSEDGEGSEGLTPEEALEEEDIEATGESAHGTTIEDAEMAADDWVEQAAEATDAVDGDTYVELDRGVLTVDQIDNFLRTMPVELTYADDNNQFIYYNHHTEAEDMLGARETGQVGSGLADVHPESAHQNLAWVLNQLRTGEQEHVRMAVPAAGDDEQFVVHDYYGMYDDEGEFTGVNEIIHDIMPHVDFYLEETGQELTGGDDTDAESAATPEEEESSEDSEG